MSDTPASPKANRLATPGWLDGRLVLGVLLVLVSVVVGARVLSSADRSQLVWAASKDLAVGSQIGEGDLQPVRVRLFDSSDQYVRAGEAPPVGYVVRRGIGAGELLARKSVTRPEVDVDFRVVTVPVQPGHFPTDLRQHQQVDVWMTPDRDASGANGGADGGAEGTQEGAATAPAPTGAAQQVLSKVAVLAAPESGGDLAAAGSTVSIVVQVRPSDVGKLLAAMSQGRIDVVRVPREAEASGDLLPPAKAG